MRLFIKIALVLSFVALSQQVFCQFDTESPDSIENLILYNHMKTFGFVAHNLGLGIYYRNGKRISIFKTRLWEIEAVYMKSYKQKKQLNSYAVNAQRYVYGKLNDVFFLRGGIAWKKLLNDKPYWGGVEVRLHYGFGASIGIAKPYYVYAMYFYEVSPGYFSYNIKTEKFDPSQQSWDDIYGRAPFTKGLNEISLHPGVYAKIGLNFEFGKRDTKTTALEVGGIVDIIPMGIKIMSGQTNTVFYPTLYISYSFGKRFNKY